jgi:hypothetical protein
MSNLAILLFCVLGISCALMTLFFRPAQTRPPLANAMVLATLACCACILFGSWGRSALVQKLFDAFG